ncbi:hypothetical protein [Hydrogenophaga sp.]|uniref:hypothetical protein n=1 Tax=Hydrogenophaga sp. TaxID=1904254 RepID=UPI002FCC518A
MDALNDLRERITRAEENIINSKETFTAFKREDFGSLRAEVHTMRGELNEKIDMLLDKVSTMAIQNAKWMGAGGVLIFIGQFLINKLF